MSSDQGRKECMLLPNIAQQEIGLFAGLTPETTSRIFKKLRDRGVIGRRNGSLSILNSAPLHKFGLVAG